MTDGDLHSEQASWLVSALCASGVEHFVLSPGSRSTPLAIAIAREPRALLHVHPDERVAAFFALGLARVTQQPPVLVCTSGTAGAHWLPAVIEASQSYLPIILLTADRPWEAYNCHSPQTIDQTNLFSQYLRHHTELPLPDPQSLAAVGRIAAQCTRLSLSPTPGPVHINARYRKPLEPVTTDSTEAWRAPLDLLYTRGPTRFFNPALTPARNGIEALAHALSTASKIIFACGPSLGSAPLGHVETLAFQLNAVLFAETTSNRRHGNHHGATLCPHFDLALHSPSFRARSTPDLIVSWNLPPVSSSFNTLLTLDTPHWIVSPYGWPDPSNTATAIITADCDTVAREVSSCLQSKTLLSTSPWIEHWQQANKIIETTINLFTSEDTLTEASIAYTVATTLTEQSTLFLGNSMPVRDFDTFARSTTTSIRVLHQRGASGIDGVISATAGALIASKGPVVTLVGDISALHDLGGLNALRNCHGPAVIIVINNNGGRIFAELPLGTTALRQPSLETIFNNCFLTPQDFSLAHAVSAFGIAFERVNTVTDFSTTLTTALSARQPTVIEAVVSPEDATERRAALRRHVMASLA